MQNNRFESDLDNFGRAFWLALACVCQGKDKGIRPVDVVEFLNSHPEIVTAIAKSAYNIFRVTKSLREEIKLSLSFEIDLNRQPKADGPHQPSPYSE